MGHTLTTEEVAARLGITAGEVRRLLRTRCLRGTKRGRTWRVRKADLEEFLTEPFVEQGLVEEAEHRRRTSKGTLTLEELRKRLGLPLPPARGGEQTMSGSEQLLLNLQYQRNPKADDVSALIAVVRPILLGTLYAVKRDIVRQVGGYAQVTLELLARLYEPGDGDCGLCFEYAVHDALTRTEPSVTERVADGLKLCNVPGAAQSSILFAAEKSGLIQLIDTARERLTDDSRLMYGSRGQPVKLMKHIDAVATAFRRPEARLALPQSISGLWKADLIVGCTDTDRWVGTTVKINPADLEGARGLRIGIVPARERASDAIRRDEARNLVVCPVPYDGAFMEMFYRGWGIVQQVINARGRVPREVNLPRPPERQVARELAGRRSYPVTEVVEALGPVAQPHLIDTQEHGADVVTRRSPPAPQTGLVVAPMPAVRT